MLESIANGPVPSESASVLPRVIDHPVASALSPVEAMVRTASLLAALSARFAELAVIAIASSVTAIVNSVVAVLPSSLVAKTVTVQLSAVSKSRLVLSATLTTPVLESTVNTDAQDCESTLYVIPFVESSASDAEAVTPTVVAAAAFSCTVLVVASESVGEVTSNSSKSVIAIDIVEESELERSALVAVITMSQEVAVS